MPIKIDASVGSGGTNNPHDVAILQAALRKVPYQRSKPKRYFYSGPIDGRMNTFKAAILSLIHDYFGKLHPKSGRIPDTIKPNGPYMALINSFLVGDPVCKYKSIKGTPILYVQKSNGTNKSETGGDYLIPENLYIPLERKLVELPFSFTYNDVKYGKTESGDTFIDRFQAKIQFPSVSFINPKTAKFGTNFTSFFRAYLGKLLAGLPWKVEQSSADTSYITVVTKNKLGLMDAMAKLSRFNGPGRIYESTKTAHKAYIIPKGQEILKVIGQIHAARCANVGKDGGQEIETAATKKTVNEILKLAPKGFEEHISKKCKSCRELGNEMKAIQDSRIGLVNNLSGLTDGFLNFVENETSIKQYEADASDAARKAMTAAVGLTPLPFDGGSLLGDDPKLVFSESSGADLLGKITAGYAIWAASRGLTGTRLITKAQFSFLKGKANGFRFLKRLLVAVDIAKAFVAIGKVIYNTPQYLRDLKRVDDAFGKMRLGFTNTYIDIEAASFSWQAARVDFVARNCDGHYYGFDDGLKKAADRAKAFEELNEQNEGS